jgi:hypothetical protein
MSLITIPTPECTDAVIAALIHFFDDGEKIQPSNSLDNRTYRVGKESLGLSFDDDVIVEATFKKEFSTVIPANVDKCHIIITAINGVALDPGHNVSEVQCKSPENRNPDHHSEASAYGIKSKG